MKYGKSVLWTLESSVIASVDHHRLTFHNWFSFMTNGIVGKLLISGWILFSFHEQAHFRQSLAEAGMKYRFAMSNLANCVPAGISFTRVAIIPIVWGICEEKETAKFFTGSIG
jgi:hypothetical protein